MSRTRGSLYAFSIAVLMLAAYRTEMSPTEISLWENVILHGTSLGIAVLAFVKTWPRRKKDKPADE